MDGMSALPLASGEPTPMEQGIKKHVHELIEMDRKTSVYALETKSVYGSAIAFPQIARCTGYNKVYVALWLRSWMGLALNLFVQMSLVVFVGEATQIMNALGGQMHLCDFGAKLDSCPEAVGCAGPGGSKFTPPRLYGYTQWAVQKFTKQALLDILPDKEDEINAHVDPGEYGMENSKTRWVCHFLFTVSVIQEILTCLRMATMLWSVKSTQGHMDWVKLGSDDRIHYSIAGMPIHWKVITLCLVFVPKLALCHYVLLEGTLLLMDTSGIMDCVLGALSLTFVLSVDEMLFETMHTTAARKIMESLEESLQKHEEDADKEDLTAEHKRTDVHWTDWTLIRQLLPLRLGLALVVMFLYIGRYYEFKCVYSDEWGMWVSKDMFLPKSASYSPLDFVLNGFFQTVPHDDKPFWTMPSKIELGK